MISWFFGILFFAIGLEIKHVVLDAFGQRFLVAFVDHAAAMAEIGVALDVRELVPAQAGVAVYRQRIARQRNLERFLASNFAPSKEPRVAQGP